MGEGTVHSDPYELTRKLRTGEITRQEYAKLANQEAHKIFETIVNKRKNDG